MRARHVLPAMIALAALPLLGRGVRPFEVKGFKLADYFEPPHETQMKFLLEGAKARPLEDGRMLITDAKLQTLLETGEHELLVLTPECFYDPTAQSASSSGALQVQTADGKFSIAGDGFLWRQTNSSLIISNHVHTVVHADLLEPAPDRPKGGPSPRAASGIEILSDRFDYDAGAGLGVYRGNVRVAGTNLGLASGVLTVKVPMNERQLQSITAEHQVVVDYGDVRATGDQAVYTAATGLVRMSGRPAWRAGQREGRAEELLIDRTNRLFQANGQAWLKLPDQTLGESGFLSRPNDVRALKTTNSFIEIACDRYEFHTNSALFRQDVRLTEHVDTGERGRLSCGLLTASFAGSNQLQRLVAEQHVVIEQDTNRFTGDTAVYTGASSLLELTGHPTWRSGPREGKGDLVRVNLHEDEMQVRGGASLRLPAEQLAQSPSTFPAASGLLPGQTAATPFADVFCEEYSIRPERALFRGGVYASHPRMNWACETLTLTVSGGDRPLHVITAEQAVVFDLKDERGQKVHGTGDKATYTYGVQGNVTNDLVNLTGNPALLETTNGTVRNRVIVLDRANNKLAAPGGDYVIRGSIQGADTNLLAVPNLTKPK